MRPGLVTGKRAAVAACVALVVAGCALQPSEVVEGPRAPTGVAAGVTLYFLDGAGALVAQQRETGRLGSVSEAVSFLLTGPGDSDVSTEIAETDVTQTSVTIKGDLLSVRVPVSSAEVTAAGADQIVCTALASHVQAGGSVDSLVQIDFTDGSGDPSACPVLP